MRAHRRTLCWIVLSVFACLPPAFALDADVLEGTWEGTIQTPGRPLDVELTFKRIGHKIQGEIDIPAQNAADLPLTGINVTGEEVTFQIEGIPGEPTFNGRMAADGGFIAGDFTQGGQSFPFELTLGVDRVQAAIAALDGINPVINAALADWKTPGLGLAVVVDGQTIMSVGYGYSDVEREVEVTSHTVFAIGSATKAFTATVLGTLVDEGKLGWDEPVASYIPDFKLYDEYATSRLNLRDMLSHRSGLPRHDLAWYNNEDISRAEMVRRLRYLEPNKDLRQAWQYNNLMYATAGQLIEHVAEMNWEQAVHQRLLEPLGMTRTQFLVSDSEADPGAARPYVEEDDELRQVAYRPIGVMGPAGSINSCTDDLAMWMNLNLSGGSHGGRQLLSADTLREIHSPQMAIPGLPKEPELSPVSYGLGWFLQTYRGHYQVSHGGNIDGFSALVTLFPNSKAGIAVLVNKGGSPLPDLVTRTISDRLLGLESIDWIGKAAAERDAAKDFIKQGQENKAAYRVEGTKPSRKLEAFAGRFEHPGYGVAEIAHEGKRLTLLFNDMTMPLEHWHYDIFNVADYDEEVIPENLRVSFLTDERGRAAKIAVGFEPNVDPIEFRRLPAAKLSDPEYLARLAGDYQLPNQLLTFRLQGDALVVIPEGQRARKLIPVASDEFEVEDVGALSIKFTVPEAGNATEAVVIQPGGVFPAKRK
jgi:CubicO group peptidase (beta-lactamase class C family)